MNILRIASFYGLPLEDVLAMSVTTFVCLAVMMSHR